jgi:hypothetical protein
MELCDLGRELASELRLLASSFHVKSDARDILEYEVASLEARVDFLEKGRAIPEHLKESTILSEWGSDLRKRIPVETEKVVQFHKEFLQAEKSPNSAFQPTPSARLN